MVLFTLFPLDIARLIISHLPGKQQMDIWLKKNEIFRKDEKVGYIMNKDLVDAFNVCDTKQDRTLKALGESTVVDYVTNINLKANEEFELKRTVDFYTGLIIETKDNEKVNVKIRLEHGCGYISHQFEVQGLQRVPFMISSDCCSHFWRMFIIPDKPIRLDLQGVNLGNSTRI